MDKTAKAKLNSGHIIYQADLDRKKMRPVRGTSIPTPKYPFEQGQELGEDEDYENVLIDRHVESFLIRNYLKISKHSSTMNERGGNNIDYDDDYSNLQYHAKNVISTLISNGMGKTDGIQLSVDNPWNFGHRIVNVERPAVLRQYFGETVSTAKRRDGCGEEEYVMRACYGTGTGVGSVGTPKGHFVTREMSPSMTILAEIIHRDLKKRLNSDKTVSVEPFNHVTILMYYQKSVDENKNHKRKLLEFHTDNVYSINGMFINKKNSQKEKTVTAILTLGNERVLKFQKQLLVDNEETGKQIWEECGGEDSFCSYFRLSNGSLFVLHPNDEIPKIRKELDSVKMDCTKSRFRHGGIDAFKARNKLSVALVFRNVTTVLRLHRKTGKLPKPLLCNSAESTKNELFRKKLKKFRRKRLRRADLKLKDLWRSVCTPDFDLPLGSP